MVSGTANYGSFAFSQVVIVLFLLLLGSKWQGLSDYIVGRRLGPILAVVMGTSAFIFLASVFALAHCYIPTAFARAQASCCLSGFWEALYFAIAAGAGTSFGDFAPVSGLGRFLACEQVLLFWCLFAYTGGILYLTLQGRGEQEFAQSSATARHSTGPFGTSSPD